MKKWHQGSEEKYELNICSTTLGKPGEGERTSIPHGSFRRDLTIVCECVGVTGSQLFVSNDQRFLNTVAHSDVVRRLFKKAANKTLGIHQFDIHIMSVGKVVKLNEEVTH